LRRSSRNSFSGMSGSNSDSLMPASPYSFCKFNIAEAKCYNQVELSELMLKHCFNFPDLII
jgi:hypothetical protein